MNDTPHTASPKAKKSVMRELLEWTGSILGAVVFALLIHSFAFAQSEVRMSSMEDTLVQGQRVIEYKLGYYLTRPQRGDIIILNREKGNKGLADVFLSNVKEMYEGLLGIQNDDHLIKRVIGIPGDLIDIRDGYLYINGVQQSEPYIKGQTDSKEMEVPATVPPGSVFVMGDNREVSLDSRSFGFVRYDQVEGKAVFRIWPLDKFGKIGGK